MLGVCAGHALVLRYELAARPRLSWKRLLLQPTRAIYMGKSITAIVGIVSCELLCAFTGAQLAALPLTDGAPCIGRLSLDELWRRDVHLFPLPEDPELLLLLLPEAATSGSRVMERGDTRGDDEAWRESALGSGGGSCGALEDAYNGGSGECRLLLDLRCREFITVAPSEYIGLGGNGQSGGMLNRDGEGFLHQSGVQWLAADSGIMGLALLLLCERPPAESTSVERPGLRRPASLPERLPAARLELRSHPARGPSVLLLRLDLPAAVDKTFQAVDGSPTMAEMQRCVGSIFAERSHTAVSLVGTHVLVALDSRLLLCRLVAALPPPPSRVSKAARAAAAARSSPKLPLSMYMPHHYRFVCLKRPFETNLATATGEATAAADRTELGDPCSDCASFSGVHPLEVALVQLLCQLPDEAKSKPRWLAEHLGATELLSRARHFCGMTAALLRHTEEVHSALGAQVAVATYATHWVTTRSPSEALWLRARDNAEPLGSLLAEQFVWTLVAPRLLAALSDELSDAQAQLAQGATKHLRDASASRSQTPTPPEYLLAKSRASLMCTWDSGKHVSEGRGHRERCLATNARLWTRICTEPFPSGKLNAIVELCDVVAGGLQEPSGQRSGTDDLLLALTDSAAQAVLSGCAPQLLAQLQLAAAALSAGGIGSWDTVKARHDKARYCLTTATIAVRVLLI